MLNYRSRKLKEEFSIKPDKKYKHYWYLNLYAYYLTHEDIKDKSTFVFVDETQDLSPSEIELIYKVNVTENSASEDMLIPVMNLFGDVNQTISSHGVKDWNELNVPGSPLCNKLNSSIRTLYENFRNPNQIVEYCNKEFSFTMEKVGVDMDPVAVYPDLEGLYKDYEITSDIPIIVKDEYTRKDLTVHIKRLKIKAPDIYTVKEVKGLEYSEVIIIDKNMTDNERYIAYTRALKKLFIINFLSVYVDHNSCLYEQSDSSEEIEERDVTDIADELPEKIQEDGWYNHHAFVEPEYCNMNIIATGELSGTYALKSYSGKLKSITSEYIMMSILNAERQRKKTIPIAVDIYSKTIYIEHKLYRKHKEFFINNKQFNFQQ